VDFEWEYVNPAAAKILHSTPEALVCKRLLEVLPGHKDNSLFDRFVQVVETGITLDIESYYNSEGMSAGFGL
jgi:PAS domain-containing protein